jgi:predicted helicase
MRQSLMETFDEVYILDLHGNSLKRETTPEGGKDENVFDIRQGVAIALFVKNKKQKESVIYHSDLYGLRQEKYDWLDKNEFLKENYVQIKPQSPYYFFVKRNTETIKKYLDWKKINEIFPISSVGIVTARDKFVIDFKKNELRNRILQFKNLSQPDDIIAQAYNLTDKSNWKIQYSRKKVKDLDGYENYIKEILYRPFDNRYIFYHQSLIERMRLDIMRHMLEDNIGLITHKREELNLKWSHAFITSHITEHGVLSSKTTNYHFPLYLYPNKEENNSKNGTNIMLFETEDIRKTCKPNIDEITFEKLKIVYKQKPTPEEILYYIYAIFYSNIYRETYAEFLKIDFPCVPFTSNYDLFIEMGKLGKELANLHLLKSSELDSPIAKYQGSGDNDRIEKVTYQEDKQRIYINKEKYFEGVAPEIWNYHIGGYQVLHKYLKDRKDRMMDDAPRYCRIVTALYKTIEIQKQIDKIYPEIEKNLIRF